MKNVDGNYSKIIKIGGGFRINRVHQKYFYPSNRLTTFLNVDSSNEKSIRDYCYQYNFLPTDLTNLTESFIEEQNTLRELVEKTIKQSLTAKDIDTINEVISHSKMQLGFITEEDALLHNERLAKEMRIGQDIEKDYSVYNLRMNKKNIVPILTQTHKSYLVSLYLDVVDLILGKSAIKTCIKCGRFFKINNNFNLRQIFCSEECANSLNHKQRYHAKKRSS